MSDAPAFLIQRARPEDAGALCDLLCRLKTQYASGGGLVGESFRDRYLHGIASAIVVNSIWVATASSTDPIGFADFSQRMAPRVGGVVGSLEEIFVVPEWRRKGVGTALWLAGVEECKALGISTIEIITSMAHPGQREFFSSRVGASWYAAVHRVTL